MVRVYFTEEVPTFSVTLYRMTKFLPSIDRCALFQLIDVLMFVLVEMGWIEVVGGIAVLDE